MKTNSESSWDIEQRMKKRAYIAYPNSLPYYLSDIEYARKIYEFGMIAEHERNIQFYYKLNAKLIALYSSGQKEKADSLKEFIGLLSEHIDSPIF